MTPLDLIKHNVVGTSMGRLLGSARDVLQVLHAAVYSPESVGTVANDLLATVLVSGLCNSNKTFVDVGAHIGSVIATVMYKNPSVSIVAVEAIPSKAKFLRKKFPKAVIHECAAGDRDAVTSFYINTRETGYSSLIPIHNTDATAVEVIEVPIRRLDATITQTGIDLIKIDVEGAELAVIRGATEIIARDRPVIMFESAPSEATDGKTALWECLAGQQYGVLVPNRVAHLDDGLDLNGFLDSHLYPRRTTNYFAIPVERRVSIRAQARALQHLDRST